MKLMMVNIKLSGYHTNEIEISAFIKLTVIQYLADLNLLLNKQKTNE
jgi:hypothetical protein